MLIYLIGSLRNPQVPQVGNELRAAGLDVFDNWHAAGERADDAWMEYERKKGNKFKEALESPEAIHVFQFDFTWLRAADGVVLMLPAGKSGHLELGWALGKGKPGWILLNGEPERYDVMYKFASAVHTTVHDLVKDIQDYQVSKVVDRMEGKYTFPSNLVVPYPPYLTSPPIVYNGPIDPDWKP